MPITKTITITLYTFDELPTEKAKEAARDWWRQNDFDWYEGVYEDAAQAGVKIKSFDIGRGQDIEIDLLNGDTETAEYILQNHGKSCDTYKAAAKWDAAIDALPELPDPLDWNNEAHREIERELCESRDAIDAEFMEDLAACYLRALREEYEYRYSAEYIDETLQANEYTFTETGKREDA